MKNKLAKQYPKGFIDWLSRFSGQQYGVVRSLANQSLVDVETVDDLLAEIVDKRMKLSRQYFEFASGIQPESNFLCRQIISRSYYAMHHAARAVIFATRRDNLRSHEKVIKAIGQLFGNETAKLLADQLDGRNNVEYGLIIPDKISEMAKDSIDKAKNFIQYCESYIKERR